MSLSGVLLLALLCGVTSAPTSDAETEDAVETSVMFAEFDYEEKAEQLAQAEWTWLAGGRRDVDSANKTLAEEEFAKVRRANAEYVRSVWKDDRMQLPADLRARLYLTGHPGDALLDESRYKQVLNFSSELQRQYSNLRISCYLNSTDGPCQLDMQDVQKVLATSGDVAQLLHVWRHWQTALAPAALSFPSVLQAVQEAAAANEAEDVEAYWQQLSDVNESYERAEELWQDLQPLYHKLHLYVSRWLEHNYGHEVAGNAMVNSNIPAHLLGSLLGEDWSALFDLVVPSTDTTISDIEQALHKKVTNVQALYVEALKNLGEMGLPQMDKSKFLSNFLYNGSCPADTVQFHNDGRVKALTCSSVGWLQLLDAYATSTRVVHSHLAAEEQHHVLRESICYSALLDAVPGMVSLLAASPYHLSNLGLLSTSAAYDDSTQSQKLRLMVALRTLPRLAYYLAADKWRLQLLKGNGSESLATSWGRFRKDYQRVEAPVTSQGDLSFLSDSYITSNRPYLGKFVALLYQFQLLEYFTEDDVENPVKAIRERDELVKMMRDGQSQKFLDLAVLSIEAAAILRYFEPLEALLDEPVPSNAPKVVRKPVLKVITRIIPQLNVQQEQDLKEVLGDATPAEQVENSTEAIILSVNVSDVSEATISNVSTSQIATEVLDEPPPDLNSAILFGALVVFGLALVSGFFVAGRRCYKRKYQRNRRPPSAS